MVKGSSFRHATWAVSDVGMKLLALKREWEETAAKESAAIFVVCSAGLWMCVFLQ